MLRNYRILLAILLFAVLIDRLKADDDDEENGEGNEGGDGQEGEAGEAQENEDGAANEEKEAEDGENQDGPGGVEGGKEDEEQTDKTDEDAEKPPGEDDENNEEGDEKEKNKKPGKPGLPGKDSKDENKKDDKGQQGGIDQGNKDRKKTNSAPETDKPINQPAGQGTGQPGIGQPGQPGIGQPNVNPNNNIPYSPTVYPNGLPGQTQQTNINPPNVNPINPPYVNPIPNPVYPQQTNVPLPTNPPPVYPQYPSANQQPPQQQPYSPPSGFGTSNSVNEIDEDPFGFGITLQRQQQQQYSPYSQYYSQPNQNIPPQYNPPSNNFYSNNLGGFGNSNGKRVPGQTSFPVEERSQLPMIVSGRDDVLMINNNNNSHNKFLFSQLFVSVHRQKHGFH
uniref:Candidate secreted effector n=1 Tax=Meloidogyne incognita TaxID=6306 RepID=A0A914LPD1_MELIC